MEAVLFPRGRTNSFEFRGGLFEFRPFLNVLVVMHSLHECITKKIVRLHPGHKIYPYLLRNFDVLCPNQVWCSDITYIRLPGGFVYLTAVMDWYSRYVLSWEVSVTMDSDFCISALESALRQHGQPDIFNTDQGAQYTSNDFINKLKDAEVLISMDGKGRAMDNIFIERLWRSVKYEEIYLKEYGSVRELTDCLKVYFDFYNNERTHSSLGAKTPSEIYWGCMQMQAAA